MATLSDPEVTNLIEMFLLMFVGEGLPFFDRRDDVLLRLRVDAEIAAHSRGRILLRRLPHSGRVARLVEVLRRDVQLGRLHTELSGRPGHHQPLQTATGHQDDQKGGVGGALVHQHGAGGHLINYSCIYFLFSTLLSMMMNDPKSTFSHSGQIT